MRSDKDMFDLILGFAKADSRVRAVYMNGSRANPNAPKDVYQDFDIVFVVTEFDTFFSNGATSNTPNIIIPAATSAIISSTLSNAPTKTTISASSTKSNECNIAVSTASWIDVFGDRFMLQMPEAMRAPSGEGHFNWMMLFSDGNRLDLTLIPKERMELIKNDSLCITLLDKDDILPQFLDSSDRDYIVKPPSELFYLSCCNNFYWCLQNVAKGIARDELPYAMMMFHNVVREELHEMISWFIGVNTNFSVSVGKMGKYFKKYLQKDIYEKYLMTYSNCDSNHMWSAVKSACDVFSVAAVQVARHFGYIYNTDDEINMRKYIDNVKNKVYEQ